MTHGEMVSRHRMSYRCFAGVYFWMFVWFVGVIALGVAVLPLPWWVVSIAAIAPPVAALLWIWLSVISTEYRLFQDSLEVESGIIARRIENIQLFRVRDLGMNQSLLARMLDVGDISVISTDQTAPRFVLRGVAQPRALYDNVRDLVAKSQAARRTMIVESDMTLPGS